METITQSGSSFLVRMSFAKHADDQSINKSIINQPFVCCEPDVCICGTELIAPWHDTLQQNDIRRKRDLK